MSAINPMTPEQQRTAQLLALATVATTAIMAGFAAFSGQHSQLLVEGGSMVVAIIAYLGLRKNAALWAAPMTIAVIGCNILYSSLETGGTSSVTIGWVPILTIAAYAISGRAMGIAAAVFGLLTLATIFTIGTFDLLPVTGQSSPGQGLIELVLMTSVALGVIYLFEASERRKFEREREADRRVAAMNRDLQQALDEVAELESRLIESERHGSLQRLAGHFAHDFNNLLTGIMAEVDLVAHTTTDGEAKEGLENALVSARKAAELTRTMLTYSGHRTTRLADTTAAEIFDDVQKLAELSTRHGADIRRADLTEGAGFQADVTQIEQALLNLVLNGVQASSDDRPVIELTARYQDVEQPIVGAGGTQLGCGRAIWLEVRDFGGGVPEDLRAAIFEPYFTTRQEGQGLGLSSVIGIVRSHRGALRLETHEDGTTMAIGVPTDTNP